MNDYEDFNMNTPDGNHTVTGICHAKGGNANLPPKWLLYITVENVDESAKICLELGGGK